MFYMNNSLQNVNVQWQNVVFGFQTKWHIDKITFVFCLNCCFKKASSTVSSCSFYERVCNGSDWVYTLKDKDSADGWLDSEVLRRERSCFLSKCHSVQQLQRPCHPRCHWSAKPATSSPVLWMTARKIAASAEHSIPGSVPLRREPELEPRGRVTPSASVVFGAFKRASERIFPVCVLSVVH